MEESKFSFQLTPTNPGIGLGFEVWVDDHCVFNSESVTETQDVNGPLPPDSSEQAHVLKLVLKNKQSCHTVIDDAGNIISDALLKITEIKFDGINLDTMFNSHAVYCHDFNGTQPVKNDQFFGAMGCNGTVSLEFTTPIYLWLLEKM